MTDEQQPQPRRAAPPQSGDPSDETIWRADLRGAGSAPQNTSAQGSPAQGSSAQGSSARGSSTWGGAGASAWSRPSRGHKPAPTPDLTAPAPRPGPTHPVDAEDKTIDAASLQRARVTDDPEKNPFAPKPSPRAKKSSVRDMIPFGKKKDDGPAAPVGRRVAERKPWFRIPTRAGKQTDARNITATAITGAAVVLTVVLLAGFLFWNANREQAAMAQSATPTAEPTNSPGPLVSEGTLMTPEIAQTLDPQQEWTATQTSDQVGEQSMGVACVTTTPEGQPVPSGGTYLRTLTGSGDDAGDSGDARGTAALHRVDGFGSVDEASSYFQFRSTELGGCQGSPLYVEQGYAIDGLGDEAVGVRLALQNQDTEYHTVVLARTGQNVNIVDVAQTGEPVAIDKVVDAARQVINAQCGAAAGLCSATDMSVEPAVPPPGGDEPGFLAAGDIPRVSRGTGQWDGNKVTSEISIGNGSNCEAIDFSTVEGPQKRQQRTYLLRNDPEAPPEFGIDEVQLEMQGLTEAADLVKKVGDNIAGCKSRLLTADVPQQGQIDATGAGDMEVTGRWFTVTQELGGNQRSIYRVGIIQSGEKVIYTRMNPTAQFDLDDQEWESVNARAGQRATQTN